MDITCRSGDGEGGPEHLVLIEEGAPRPVVHGVEVQGHPRRQDGTLPPVVNLDARLLAHFPEQDLVTERGDKTGPITLLQTPQGRQVEVIIMIVADQDDIDRRQVLPGYPRGMDPPRPKPGKGAGPLRPDRVGEDIEPLGLQQYGGVADPGDPQIPAEDPGWRLIGCRQGLGIRPVPPLAGQAPFEKAAKTLIHRLAGVGETPAVEMLGDRDPRCGTAAGNQRQQCHQQDLLAHQPAPARITCGCVVVASPPRGCAPV